MKVAGLIFALLGGLVALASGLITGCAGALAESTEIFLWGVAAFGGFVLGIIGGGVSLKNPKAAGIILTAATVLAALGASWLAAILFAIGAITDFIASKEEKELKV